MSGETLAEIRPDDRPSFQFGGKARTLAALKPLITRSTVADLYYFSAAEWRAERTRTLGEIQSRFPGQSLIVRSSALAEDGADSSLAGRYCSHANVASDDREQLAAAIDEVTAAYDGNPLDEALIQPMIDDIAVSGVITTYELTDGGPYYTINYDDESGKTDTITGGTGVSKTVRIYRHADFDHVASTRVRRWLEMARELEDVCGPLPLDIEFGQTHGGELFLFQARRIAVARNWNREVERKVARAHDHVRRFVRERARRRPGLYGARTILGMMPDWNPAEMIGAAPKPLAVSLYRRLITDRTWRKARAFMGYHHPARERLMTVIGGRPFIDARASFNSFLPRGLDGAIAEKLVNAWLDRLDDHPELHDKVEFEVAVTARDFNFDSIMDGRWRGLLKGEERRAFESALTGLTRSCLDLGPNGALARAEAMAARLERARLERRDEDAPALVRAEALLADCRHHGVFGFAVIARCAFIAEALLRSATTRGAWPDHRLDAFKASLVTVLTRMNRAFQRAFEEPGLRPAFLAEHGHLRPGAYDIQSQRYDQREDLFQECFVTSEEPSPPFALTAGERAAFAALLAESGLGVSPETLLAFAARAITGRESAKFAFTKNLSDALELIAGWGEAEGLTREDLSHLTADDLFEPLWQPALEADEVHFKTLAERAREDMALTRGLRLGYLIRDGRDLDVIPVHRAAPNYVTHRRVTAKCVFLDGGRHRPGELYGAVACVENADPGFDWIFTRGIAGLITQYGGVNSHMAIRCSELGLPAAIGCGEVLFERLKTARRVELDCGDRTLRPLFG